MILPFPKPDSRDVLKTTHMVSQSRFPNDNIPMESGQSSSEPPAFPAMNGSLVSYTELAFERPNNSWQD
jgi:hypothetical protein